MADPLPPPTLPPPSAAPTGPPPPPPPEPAAGPPDRRRLWIGLIVVGSILAVALIIGLIVTLVDDDAAGGSSGGGDPFELDVALTNAADTSAFEYTMSFTVADEELVTVDGAVDGDLAELQLDLGALGLDFLAGGTAEVIIDGGDGVLYVNADEVLPPVIDLFIPDVEWLALGLDSLVGGAEGTSLNPLDLIDGLDDDGADATDLGAETIDGVETHRYQYVIETADVLGTTEGIIEMLDNLGLGVEIPDVSIGEATVDVWVTEDDQVRRVAVGVADERAALVIDIESSGDDVEIELPDPDDVFDVSDLLGF